MRDGVSRMLSRFEDSYIPEPMSGCFLWIGGVWKTHGYTAARFFNSIRKNYDVAPRFAWELFRGEIPDGLWVLHKCDNSLCVNPDHLYLGDCVQNIRDRENRKRGRHHRDPKGMRAHILSIRKLARHDGEKHSHKLTWEDVRTIRASDLSNKELGIRHSVSPVHIWNIRHNKYWKTDVP